VIKDRIHDGRNILVARSFEGRRKERVILPGRQIGSIFYRWQFVGENEVITVSSRMEKIPLYVRDGRKLISNATRFRDRLLNLGREGKF